MMRLITVLLTLFFMTTLFATEGLQPPEAVANTPEKRVVNVRILQRSIELYNRGEVTRKIGVGLVIPGTIFAVISIASIGIGISMHPDPPTPECSESMFGCNLFGDLYLAFLIPGVLGLIANTFIIIAGASKISKGKAMIGRAEKMKKKAYRVSFRIVPLISPKNKSYGVMLSLNY